MASVTRKMHNFLKPLSLLVRATLKGKNNLNEERGQEAGSVAYLLLTQKG